MTYHKIFHFLHNKLFNSAEIFPKKMWNLGENEENPKAKILNSQKAINAQRKIIRQEKRYKKEQ